MVHQLFSFLYGLIAAFTVTAGLSIFALRAYTLPVCILKIHGRAHRGGAEGAAVPQYLACQHICRISIVRINLVLMTKLKESPICRQLGLECNLFVGKLGTNEICLSANWVRTKSVCRQIGYERNLFVGKLGTNEICLSANWRRALHQQFSVASPL